MFDLNKKNVGGADVYGLLPDDDVKFNGWFADYIFIRGGKFGSTFFNVSDLDLDSVSSSSHAQFWCMQLREQKQPESSSSTAESLFRAAAASV